MLVSNAAQRRKFGNKKRVIAKEVNEADVVRIAERLVDEGIEPTVERVEELLELVEEST